ncbi:hypothetical protein CQ018_04190 [Arthrobacter sp. MYb227]|uniref:hypothetical protein n=1 Tax=Arthrobacter sp. MYb227 TaxID=1848601 RepID=UPI000CFB60F5|nr:hypothetical protein [Arthrobacter sp. MYb227]PQZ94564.1 hypothetical protein CQ018_04190 [Arthrobacter sp. MYb227]
MSIKAKLGISPTLRKRLVRELAPGPEIEYRFLDPADEEIELLNRPGPEYGTFARCNKDFWQSRNNVKISLRCPESSKYSFSP